ncbi:sulfotransferase family protein [Cohnella zeiphila]|uniref:Sulfotransferase n=1 Tax=Cohnella zeiphila TaxID=2761120 RepID=A0A7X0SW97_9BACL|nr:sulfotransferase [Cohnella zeiphila]MBB6735123.1 sulfotransferase [Cohnella zeiphila]
MVGADGNNLVFLLCTPRSGSSLATVMLQNHSEMFATQEMWFLMSLHDLREPPRRAYGGGAILDRFFNGVLPGETFEEACRSFALQAYNGLLRGGGGADVIIDKSPRYYYLLEFLDALFPRSRRIWLIRNPFAVLSSYKKIGAARGEKIDLEALLGRSDFEIKAADLTVGLFRYQRYFSRPDPYAFRLHYEKLVAEPQAQLSEACRFLGKEYEEGMEIYGAGKSDAKTDLFFSMGVGDPFVADHSAPHGDSVHAWKEVLTKREAELYGRMLGAKLFAELGYAEELAEAEKWTGVRFDPEPDAGVLKRLGDQLAEATGCRWQADYRMRSDLAAGAPADLAPEPETGGRAADSELMQLRMTVRALEQRLEDGVMEQRRLRSQIHAMRRKADWLKSAIPFGKRLSRLASAYMSGSGGKK